MSSIDEMMKSVQQRESKEELERAGFLGCASLFVTGLVALLVVVAAYYIFLR